MDDARDRIRLWGPLSAGLVAVTTIVGVVANYTALLERFNWLLVVLLSVNFLAVAAAIHATRLGLKIAAQSEDSKSLVLSSTREEIEAKITALWKNVKSDQCRRVDIMGLSLRRGLFKRDGAFGKWLLGCIRSNPSLQVRIMLTDPQQQDIVQQREFAERGTRSGGHLVVACKESLETLHDIVLTIWKEQRKRRPEIVLVTEVPIQQWLLRIDDVMIVALYLQHDTGTLGPAFELKKGERWFEIFDDQFTKCFRLHSHNLFPQEGALSAVERSGPTA